MKKGGEKWNLVFESQITWRVTVLRVGGEQSKEESVEESND